MEHLDPIESLDSFELPDDDDVMVEYGELSDSSLSAEDVDESLDPFELPDDEDVTVEHGELSDSSLSTEDVDNDDPFEDFNGDNFVGDEFDEELIK